MFKFSKLPSAVIAIALTVAMLFSVAIPTLAYTASVGSVADDVNGKEIVGQDVDQGKQTEYSDGIAVGNTTITSDCDVYATVPDSGIVVTVPKVQILDGKSAAANVGVYTVAVRGDISAKTVITVEPQDEMDDRDGVNFEMTSAGKAGIPTDVDQAKTMFTYADGVRPDTPATTTGTITAHGMTAGIWNGDFMFNISTGIAQPKDETTYYTAEEIDASEYLFPIGKTDPYYVVAKFNEDFTEVVITKNGEDSDGLMMDWDWGGTDPVYSPFYSSQTLTSVVVKEGVASIGQAAFLLCENLTDVVMPDSLTEIGDAAFSNCYALSKIEIGKNVTSIGWRCFYTCNNLTRITLPDNLQSVGREHFSCGSQKIIFIIPETATFICDNALSSSGATVEAIYGKHGTYAETWAVENGYEFVGLDSLEHAGYTYAIGATKPEYVLAVFNEDYSEVTIMKNGENSDGLMMDFDSSTPSPMKEYKATLTKACIQGGVSNLGQNTFQSCSNLSSVDFSGEFDTFSVGSGAFLGTGIKNITLPAGTRTIGTYAFYYCYLESLTIPATVTSIDGALGFAPLDGFAVYGETGSYAETWANNNGYTFVAI